QQPEFEDWRWVDYWMPVNEIIAFKRRVYWQALQELAPLINMDPPPMTNPCGSAGRYPVGGSS
ncbi:MAG: RNA pyrophosphohydrolase, partial [Acidithiobacillus sp.]